MSNRLKDQSSPYLLQHASNPVDWYPWGEEAFEKAHLDNKPVFLSIGYSTCHWCHVMAHESFENPEIAEILNQYFVSVKVDREERPDIDSVYMEVCQTLTGSGGWPLSIFLTADQKPFYAGTYFPPAPRYGTVGFRELLLGIADAWKNQKEKLLESAEQILDYITVSETASQQWINKELPEQAAQMLTRSFDKEHGGFGRAPKFPMPHNLVFLTLYSMISGDDTPFTQVKRTLEQMRRGGIFDQIGYGFSRYSTDPYFLVPHFEKMLYDNGLLIIAYCAAYKRSGDRKFLEPAEKTAEYIFREMTGSEGEFYSAQDADSEGEEGKFYIWSYEEICEILGREKGESFCQYFGITKKGNFEGKNIPNLLNGNEISGKFESETEHLFAYRNTRTKLHLDDKILTSWNSLMICAMAVLYRTTGRKKYLQAAERAEQFIEENLMDGQVLYVSCRRKKRSVKGFLEEYAYFAAANLCLYGATKKSTYLENAEEFCREAGRQFSDKRNGGYFLYGEQNSRLITRPKETYDGALPSGNSVMAFCLVRLSQITEKEEFRMAAEEQLAFLSQQAASYPAGYGMFLIAELLYLHSPQKITAVVSEQDSVEEIISRLPLLADIDLLETPTEEYRLLNQKTTYYVCRDHRCLPPSNQEPFWN